MSGGAAESRTQPPAEDGAAGPAVPAAKVRKLAPYFFSCFVDFIGYSLCLPILPYMIMDLTPTNQAMWAGAMLTLFSLGQAIGGAICGTLSDRFGRRPIVVGLVWGSALCYFATGFVATLWQLLAIRFASGLVAGSIPATQAAISDLCDGKERKAVMAYFATAQSVAFVVGPGMAGLLAPLGFQVIFIIVGSWTAFFAVIICIIIRETKDFSAADVTPTDDSKGPTQSAESMPPIPAAAKMMFFVMFLVANNFSSMNATAAFVMKNKHNEGPRTLGLLLMGIGVFGILSQCLLVTRVYARFPPPWVLVIAIMIMTVFLCVWPFVPTFLLMVIFFLCYMIGFYFIMPGMPLVLSMILPMPIMGKGMGLNMMSFSLGRTLGPLISGALYDATQEQDGWAAFAAGSLCSAIAGVLMTKVALQLSAKQTSEQKEDQSGGAAAGSTSTDAKPESSHV